MRCLATLIGDELVNPQGERVSPERIIEVREIVRVETVIVPCAVSTVDEIVETLANIIAATKELPPEDQRRVRDFLNTARSVLFSTGYLPDEDQALFQDALRSAVVRGQ